MANCTITGQILKADGTPDAFDTIWFIPTPAGQVIAGVTVILSPVSTTTDVNGNLVPISLVQGAAVQVVMLNAQASPISAFVPLTNTATFSNMIAGTNLSSAVTLNTLVQPATGNYNMGGNLITNLGQAANNGDALSWGNNAVVGNLQVTGTLTTGQPASSLIVLFDRLVGNPAVNLVNTNAPTNVYTKTITGGTLGTDGALRVTLYGDALNNTAGAQTYRIQMFYSGSVGADTGVVSFNQSPYRRGVKMEFVLMAAGTTTNQYAYGFANMTAPIGAGQNLQATSGALADASASFPLSVNSAFAQLLAVQVLLGIADPNLDMRIFAVYVEQIQP